MSMDRKDEGASASALVRDEQVRDLRHDALAERGTGGEVAYDLLSNELLLDGSTRLIWRRS